MKTEMNYQSLVNDSLYTQPNLSLTQRGAHMQAGWQTVLFPGNLKTGKNRRIAFRTTTSGEEKTLIAIPFRYLQEKL